MATTIVIDGQPVALHGSSLACGCKVLSAQQIRVFVETGGGGTPTTAIAAAAVAVAAPAPLVIPPLTGKPAVCEECLQAAAASGSPFLGR